MSKQKEIVKHNPSTNIVVQDNPSWWASLTPTQRSVITWSGIAVGVTALSILGFHFFQKQVRENRATKTENLAFGDNKHATWAKQFKLGFENDMWWGMGTNEALIRKTMREIPSIEDYEKVEKAYTALTQGGSLPADLAADLSASEYDEILAIKMQKPLKAKDANGQPTYSPEGWATRIKAALDYSWWGIPGTDEDAILAVFNEMPTQRAFVETGLAYQKKYTGHKFIADLDADIDSYWSFDWRAIIAKKPKGQST